MSLTKVLHHSLSPGLFLLMACIILSLCNYQDYGISWDEPVQREMGIVSFNYVFNGDQSLLTYLEKDHGVGFELPLVMLEKVMRLPDISDVYLMRHLVTHLFFLLAVFCGYMLVLNLFKNKWLATLAFVMIAFHPRLYAHSFFNSKDLPFLSMFIVCFFMAEVAFRNKRWPCHLLLGIVCGYTTSIRIMSILLICCLVIFYIIDIITTSPLREERKKAVSNALIFIGSCSLMLYLSWPILWSDPLNNLIHAYESMSHFRWDATMLFFGELIRSVDLPWTYIPGYVAITVPIIWLLAVVGAILLLSYRFLRDPLRFLKNTRERNLSLYIFCGLGPVVMVILLKSVLYDDWRHLYFIYPALVFLAVFLFSQVAKTRLWYLVPVLSMLQVGDVAWFLFRSHPHQQVYFNYLVPHKKEHLRMNFDLDYWGTSCKEGLEYILANDPSSIKVYDQPFPITVNLLIFNSNDRSRLKLVDKLEDADYYMTNFRWHPYGYDPASLLYKAEVLNSSILHVYKVSKHN